MNRALELSKDKHDPALQRLLKSITKARGKFAVATADYMSPPLPLAGSGAALGGDVPLYYSLDVSGVGGGALGAGAIGKASGGDVIHGHAHVERRNDQQHMLLYQHQHPASPQVSQESIDSGAVFGADSSAIGGEAGSAPSRSSEILQVYIVQNPSSTSSSSTRSHVFARFCVLRHCTGSQARVALSPQLPQPIKLARMQEAPGNCSARVPRRDGFIYDMVAAA